MLESAIGRVSWKNYNFCQYDAVLSAAIEGGRTIYSGAYIMPSGRSAFGSERKHRNHLKLIEKMMADRLPARLHQQQASLENAFQSLRSYPGLGDFLAYQYAIDLNYGPLLDASENDFVMPGPGALDGIRKCFSDIGSYSPSDIIRYVHDLQQAEFERLELRFDDLWGRPLHLIDCQNLFCEVDKYARVKFPDVKGRTDRSRIKQIYRPTPGAIKYWYPPKWDINERIATDPEYRSR